MFAIFYMPGLDPFYQNISSFPTMVFTFVLLICLFYWLVAVLGIIDIDFLNVDLPEPDTDIGQINALAGLLLKFGLHGVPTTITLTLVSLIGWLISYYCVHFFANSIESGFFNFIASLVVFSGSLFSATLITAQAIKPLRRFFASEVNSNKTILGKVITVRTSRVDEDFGEGTLEDGGAGLVLKIRSTEGTNFSTGEKVVAYEYLKEENVYRVMSESEFLGNLKQ